MYDENPKLDGKQYLIAFVIFWMQTKRVFSKRLVLYIILMYNKYTLK